MRWLRLFVPLALTIVSFRPSAIAQASPGASTQGGTNNPQKKNQPAPPPPQKKEYLVEIYSVPWFCVTPSIDPSFNQFTSTPATPAASVLPRCPANKLLVSSSTTASDIANAIAADSMYELKPVGADKIAIYKKDQLPDPKKDTHLTAIEQSIQQLAAPPVQYLEVIHVSKGAAKQASDYVNALNADGITAAPLDGNGGSSILLKSKTAPGSGVLQDLRARISALRWQQQVFPPTQRLFHLNAASAIKSLSGSSDSGAADKPADKSTDSSTAKAGESASSTASPSVSVTVTTGAPPSDPNKTASSPDPNAGADQKSADAKPTDKPNAKPATTTANSPQKPGAAPADSTPKPPTMQTVNDTVVYNNADGSDRDFLEKNRLMAVLDLPRPEVLLNLWSLQASSRDYHVTNNEAEAAHTAVTQHNQLLQDAIDNGWSLLSRQMAYKPQPGETGFFNPEFYSYITQKFALDYRTDSKTVSDFEPIQSNRQKWGWCAVDKYCLGFTHAFEPLRPTFTNILLSIIAANKPVEVALQTIRAMNGECPPQESKTDIPPCPQHVEPSPSLKDGAHSGEVKNFQKCVADHTKDMQTAVKENGAGDCELEDRLTLAAEVQSQTPEHLQLNCFKKQAEKSFQSDPQQQTPRVGLLRAAIADFLFNYKWATQYPHSFVPYDLSQSAQELNAEFNPLILAFNRDVAAFTQSLQTEMECKYNSSPHPSWFGKGDETFLNDGMIAVRGISGVESIVDTVTQSFFDATKPPNLTDLLKSVSDAEQNIPGVLKTNLSANEAAVLMGALNSVKPAEAKIGRQLKLDITPHALAGASSAELDVKLTAEEAGNPTFFTADKSNEDNLSRVATHDTTTKVRVESLKLFEVSAFSAMLQRPRSKFPLLPPFFEVPYFGSFISFPVPGAKVYHRSSAIISAVIVPTAADLAYGIDFTSDRLCEPASSDAALSPVTGISYGYTCHHAISPGDFNGLPLRNFHKAMVQCFASVQQTAYTGNQIFIQQAEISKEFLDPEHLKLKAALNNACADLKFSTVPPSE
jgi:hypothetical protein